jgi:ORF6N domain
LATRAAALGIAEVEQLPVVESISDRIIPLRGQRVMLDADLARLYGVETKRLNQQARRNLSRFPEDFMFELSLDEWQGMRLQNATTLHRSNKRNVAPLAFTEHGCLMLANVLRSGRAVEVSVLIVRAFVRMRSALNKLLDEIRRLTQFPETPRRGIGFMAKWPKGK